MEPYVLLDPRQKALYRDVMQESYETLMSIGNADPKSSVPPPPHFHAPNLWDAPFLGGEEGKLAATRGISPNPGILYDFLGVPHCRAPTLQVPHLLQF